MKKSIILSMLFSLTMFSLIACSTSTNNLNNQSTTQNETQVETTTEVEIIVPDYSKFNPSNMKTMGDFLAFKFDEGGLNTYQEAFTEKNFIVVENIDNVYYRAVAELPKDVSEKLWEGSSSSEEREQKIKDLVYPLPIKTLENLNDMIPSQEELDKLVGKTGKDLFDDGWTYSYYNLEDMAAGLDHGAYSFNVEFEYNGEPMQNTEDFDFYDKFKNLKIKSVRFSEIGNATNIEE